MDKIVQGITSPKCGLCLENYFAVVNVPRNYRGYNFAMVTHWGKLRAIALFRAISLLGSEVTVLTMVLREKHHGGTFIGLLMASGTIALIVWAPWAGWVSDRFSTRQIIPFTSLSAAALIYSLIHQHNQFLIILTIFVANSLAAIENPTFMALTPTLSSQEDLPKIIGFNQTLYAIAGFGAPAIGGLLVSQSGFTWPFLLDAATFLLLAFTPFAIGVNRESQRRSQGEKLKASDGLKFIVAHPYLRSLVILLAAFLLSIGLLSVASVFLITNILHGSAFIYGLSGACFSAGMVLGSVILSKYSIPEKHQAKAIFYSLISLVAMVFLMASAWHWWVVLVSDVLAGLGVAVLQTYISTAFITLSPPEIRGRVGAATNAISNTGMLGSLIVAGPLIQWIGVREELFVSAILGTLVVVVFGPKILDHHT